MASTATAPKRKKKTSDANGTEKATTTRKRSSKPSSKKRTASTTAKKNGKVNGSAPKGSTSKSKKTTPPAQAKENSRVRADEKTVKEFERKLDAAKKKKAAADLAQAKAIDAVADLVAKAQAAGVPMGKITGKLKVSRQAVHLMTQKRKEGRSAVAWVKSQQEAE